MHARRALKDIRPPSRNQLISVIGLTAAAATIPDVVAYVRLRRITQSIGPQSVQPAEEPSDFGPGS